MPPEVQTDGNSNAGDHEDGDAAIEFNEVSKSFDSGGRHVHALKGVSFAINKGGITGLIGPDGAGKTTLMRLAAGLLRPDSGHVTVLGFDTTREPLDIQARVGYMPQHFGLYEELSVHENLELYADLQGVPRADRSKRYDELMAMTGLGDFGKRLARRLSGGMKQKLGLACTLIHPPRLLLLDEATVGVDPVSRRELWAIVTRLSKEEGMTVLLSTAYLDEAERCSEAILLYQGEILGQGAPGEFSAPLEGRTFAVSVPMHSRRRAQQTLARQPGIIDAVISGSGVRIVMEEGSAPDLRALLPDMEGAEAAPVAPRFEDGYVSILHEQQAERASERSERRPETVGASKGDSGAVIEVDRAQRKFGDFYAVKGISFSVNEGEVFGLLGANGAGKSTTFRMLCGLLPSSGGSVRVAGLDLRRSAAAARARIGYMSQHFSLYGNLNVDQNLGFFSSVYGLKGKERARRIAWAHDEFQLGEVAQATSADLPLGYKQRLALACALMHEPEIIFLDEPTSGVDPLARREFWQQINALAEKGVTVLVTTHFMEEAEYCDRLAIMSAGEILDLGTPEDIKAKAGGDEQPAASMEDAFIALIEDRAGREEAS